MQRYSKTVSVLSVLIIAGSALLAGCAKRIVPPEQLLVNALAELVESKSFVARLKASAEKLPISAGAIDQTFTAVDLDAELSYDRRGKGTPDIGLTLQATDDADEGFGGELRLTDNQVYIQLNDISAVSQVGQLDLSTLEGAPFVVPFAAVPLASVGALDWLNASEFVRAAAATVVRETPDLFISIVEHAEDRVEGVAARNFTAHLNPDAVNRLRLQIAALQGVKVSPLAFEGLDQLPIEIWIGKRSGDLLKIKTVFDDVSSEFAGLDDGEASLEIIFSNINKRVRIDKLDNARPLTFPEILNVLLGQTPVQLDLETASDEQIDNPNSNQASSGSTTTSSSDENQSTSTDETAPNTDSGDTTTEHVPEVPFPIQ